MHSTKVVSLELALSGVNGIKASRFFCRLRVKDFMKPRLEHLNILALIYRLLSRHKALMVPGRFGRVIGWGYIVNHKSTGKFANTLKEICVPVTRNDVCAEAFVKEGYRVTPLMLCAGDARGIKDSCQGDSGGGLVFEDVRNKKWILGGVVSWGSSLGCGLPDKYGVYVRVAEFVSWIKNNMF